MKASNQMKSESKKLVPKTTDSSIQTDTVPEKRTIGTQTE